MVNRIAAILNSVSIAQNKEEEKNNVCPKLKGMKSAYSIQEMNENDSKQARDQLECIFLKNK